MKKYVILFILLSLVPVYIYMSGEEKKPASKQVFRIGAECDYVPNSWEESKSSSFNVPIVNREGYYADGYDIQVAKLVASDMDMVLEVKKTAWNDLLPALNNREIDAIFSSMLDTDERKKIAAFSEPYEVKKTQYAVIIDSVSPYIAAKNLEDFSGARIIGEKGTMLDEVIDQIPGVIHLQPADKIQGMINAILEGKADGAVIDIDTGQFYELTNKNLTLIKFPADGGFKLGYSGVCAGVRKDDSRLLYRINIALGKISRSERQKIMEAAYHRMMKSSF